MRVIELRAL